MLCAKVQAHLRCFYLIWIYGCKACFNLLNKDKAIKVINCENMSCFCF
jgi:hypothetical protein